MATPSAEIEPRTSILPAVWGFGRVFILGSSVMSYLPVRDEFVSLFLGLRRTRFGNGFVVGARTDFFEHLLSFGP